MAPSDRIHEATAKIVVTGELKVGSTIELSNADNTRVRVWHWGLLPPDGSEAFLADPMGSKSSFKIDRPGAYAVRLRVNAGPHESVDRTAVLVPERQESTVFLTGEPKITSAFAQALKVLENSSDYTGFVLAVQTLAGGTMICARSTTAKLRARVDEQMALQDSGAASDDGDDRPHTAVAQLRELVEWLSRDGKDNVSGLAADLAESIAITYGVE